MRDLATVFLALLGVLAIQYQSAAPAHAISYAPGWNLVAGPQGAHVVGATGSLYTLQTGDTDYETQPATAALTACRGYWAYFPSGGSLDPGPLGNASVNCSVNVSPAQFVMLGNPSASQSVIVSGGDLVYTYDPMNGYQSSTQLALGQGAWVYANGAVSISVASAAPAISAPPAAQPAPQPTTTAPAPAAGPVGPLALSASLSTSTCSGGTVVVSVTVLDGNGQGVAGATVTGTVQYRTTGHSFSFPPTNASGMTSTTVDTGRPRGGYTVQWTFTGA